MMMHNNLKHTMLSLSLLIIFLLSTEARLSRDIPALNLSQWAKLDLEFGSKVSHIHHGVANGDLTTTDGVFEYTKSLKEFLESKPEFTEEKTAYYKRNPPKSLEEARKQKNRLRKLKNRPGATDEVETTS